MNINEIKVIQIKVGESYTLAGDIGNFKKGEKVTVTKKEPSGNDIKLYLSNKDGVKDVFYLDKDDDFEELG